VVGRETGDGPSSLYTNLEGVKDQKEKKKKRTTGNLHDILHVIKLIMFCEFTLHEWLEQVSSSKKHL
jgi:hypothetical protein